MTEEYIRKARELADRYNALLIFDEIQCGVGRTGTYFAYQLLDPPVMPDVMTAAKPVACGLALGVVAANEKRGRGARHRQARDHFRRRAVGLPRGAGVLRHSGRAAAAYLGCRQLLPDAAHGAFAALFVHQGSARRGADDRRGAGFPWQADWCSIASSKGVLLNCTHDYTLRMLPPYIITEQEVDRAITVLKRVFKNAKRPEAV